MRKIAFAAIAAIMGAVLGTPLAVIGAQAYQALTGSSLNVSGAGTVAGVFNATNVTQSTAANNVTTGYNQRIGSTYFRQRGASAGINGVAFPEQIIANTVPLEIYTLGAHALTLGTNATAVLTLANGGAATFASTVTAASYTNHLGAFAATTSAQLAGVLSDEQGSGGGFVRATSPTLTTPVLGVAAATSVNFGETALAAYREGTWTPLLVSSGAVITFTAQNGNYTKIGNMVWASYRIITSNATGTITNPLTLSGLPCTVANINPTGGAAHGRNEWGVDFTILPDPNATTAGFFVNPSPLTAVTPTSATLNGGTRVVNGVITYQTTGACA